MTMTRDELVEAILYQGSRLKDPPEKLLELANRVADSFRLETEVVLPLLGPRGYDLIDEQDYVYPQGKRKAKLNSLGLVTKRDPADITHVVFHQTAVEFGVSARQIAASGGDRTLALARRALDVACHVFASRQGFYVKTHPLVDYIQHGNGYNAFSLGMEIDGRYAGLEDDPATVAREDLNTTWKGDPTELTEQTIRAACAALQYLVIEGRKQGMPLTHVVAHRQSSPTRRSDPGQAIWQEVVLGYAESELGLQVDLDDFLTHRKGPGRAIPHQWDSRSHARY